MVERILDANFNRLREGLRVIEDIVRFYINDLDFEDFKSLRHSLKEIEKRYYEKGLFARDSLNDLGAKSYEIENNKKNIKDLLIANFKRIEESSRSLEEAFFLINPKESQIIKEIRYKFYDLEKKILSKILKPDLKLNLYLITDSRLCNNLEKTVSEAIENGVDIVQLREKHLNDREIFEVGKKILAICHHFNIPLVIDDRIDICLALGADGVHLGQNDIPISVAREILGFHRIIGKSTHSKEQALEACLEPLDYFAFGPLFATPTKDYTPVGLELISEIVKLSEHHKKPVVFIGGINEERLNNILTLGVRNIAVVREIMSSNNVKEKTRSLKTKLLEFQK